MKYLIIASLIITLFSCTKSNNKAPANSTIPKSLVDTFRGSYVYHYSVIGYATPINTDTTINVSFCIAPATSDSVTIIGYVPLQYGMSDFVNISYTFVHDSSKIYSVDLMRYVQSNFAFPENDSLIVHFRYSRAFSGGDIQVYATGVFTGKK